MDHRAGGRRPAESKSHNQRSVVGYGRLSPTAAAAASNDRVNMLLMEANEISRYLNKEYVRSDVLLHVVLTVRCCGVVLVRVSCCVLSMSSSGLDTVGGLSALVCPVSHSLCLSVCHRLTVTFIYSRRNQSVICF